MFIFSGDAMHSFMNDQWAIISKEFGVPMIEKPVNKIFNAIKTYLHSQPLEEIAIIWNSAKIENKSNDVMVAVVLKCYLISPKYSFDSWLILTAKVGFWRRGPMFSGGMA